MQLELTTIKRQWIDDAVASFPSLKLPPVFCADDLHKHLPEPTEANWLGCFFAVLRNSKRIRRVGYKVSERPSRNGAEVKTWEKI